MSRADAAIVLALWPGRGTSLPGCICGGRPVSVRLAWHDTPDGVLAADGLSLRSCPEGWRLERLRPAAAVLPCAVLRAADSLDALGDAVPAGARPAAAWQGTHCNLTWTGPEGDVALTVWQGAVAGTALGRVLARGPPAALSRVAVSLAEAGFVAVPAASMADAALACAGVRPLPLAGPAMVQLRPGQDVGDAAADSLGNLVDLLIHLATMVTGPGDPHPVHRMRVATTRLRAMLSMLRHEFPGLSEFAAPIRECALHLGEARDWDVFLSGAGHALLDSFPGDVRCAALLRAATRARGLAYAGLHEYLSGPGFRAVTVALAVSVALQPWRETDGDAAAGPVESLAAAALTRRHRAARRAGRDIDQLSAPALHDLRKTCKRLRYVLDVVAPLYPARPARRLLRRLSALQEELGTLNDAATVPALLDRLGRPGRGYAAGLLAGMAAERAAAARDRVAAAWTRVRAVEPFWDV